jgi:uncharacterized membrane protein YccC
METRETSLRAIAGQHSSVDGSGLENALGRDRQGRWKMGTILIIVLVILLLGGGGGYYGYSRYGGSGLGGVLGLVLVILLLLWFFGGLHINR